MIGKVQLGLARPALPLARRDRYTEAGTDTYRFPSE
jgi:hypothetical protein